jgi:hypothetical protein
VVLFRNDLDTFCKYIALRPPNIDRAVHQHIEDRHLEKATRGLYYVARYRHQPVDGEVIAVALEQFCGRLDPDEPANLEGQATAIAIAVADRRVREAAAQVEGHVCKGADRYTGEIVSP